MVLTSHPCTLTLRLASIGLHDLLEKVQNVDILIFILTTFGLGVLCSIPTIVVGRLLAARGVVREMPVWVLTAGVGAMFLSRLLVPQAPVALVVAIVAIFLPLGMYRADLWTYFREGKLSKNDE